MSPLQTAKRDLKTAEFVIKRKDGKHEIYYHAAANVTIPVKRHDFNDNDLKNLRKQIRKALEEKEKE